MHFVQPSVRSEHLRIDKDTTPSYTRCKSYKRRSKIDIKRNYIPRKIWSIVVKRPSFFGYIQANETSTNHHIAVPYCIFSMKTVDERVSSSTVDRRGEVGGSTKGSDSSSSTEDSASDGCVSENLEVRYGLLLSANGSSPAEDCASTVWLEENEVSRAPFWYTDPSTEDCVLDPWVTEDGRSWVSALAQKGSQETVVVAVDNLVGVVETVERSNSFTDGS